MNFSFEWNFFIRKMPPKTNLFPYVIIDNQIKIAFSLRKNRSVTKRFNFIQISCGF